MSIVYLLLPVALLLGFCFLALFIRLGMTGQFDDLDTPAYRILLDDDDPTFIESKSPLKRK